MLPATTVLETGWQRRRTPGRRVIAAWKWAAGSVGALYDRLPLLWRVLLINASILTVAVLLLALTPFTVSFPIAVKQALVLVAALVLMVVLNGLLLRGGLRPLLSVLAGLEDVELLDQHRRLPEVGGAETRAVARAVNTTLERLGEERRSSSRRVLAALEGERRRVGQELHDEIGQRLTGILLELNPAITVASDDARPRLIQIQEDARATLEEVGQLAWQLRPSILDDLGLVAALDALIEGLGEHAEVELTRALPPELPLLEPEVELAIFRIGQEAITNAVRHADASRIDVGLAVDNGGLRLQVSDDGRGLPAPAKSGPGIQGMRERAMLIDANLRIDSPGEFGGVTVELSLPRLSPEQP
jgi:two-component system sensor histidine kinase UhpB